MSKVLINFIQDRSGSMSDGWKETLNGFKVFVNDLKTNGKKDGVEYLFSLTTFDTLIDTPIIAQPIDSVDENALVAHGPRGNTALYDAVGVTIQNVEKESHGAEKIICVIVTDGYENSSREWTKDSLHAAVEAKLTLGNWTFTYLGTQPETWDDAAAMGVHMGSTRSYTKSQAPAAYVATSGALHKMSTSAARGSRTVMASYLDDSVMASAGMGKHPDEDDPGVPSSSVYIPASPAVAPTPPSPKPPKVTGKSTTRRWR